MTKYLPIIFIFFLSCTSPENKRWEQTVSDFQTIPVTAHPNPQDISMCTGFAWKKPAITCSVFRIKFEESFMNHNVIV
jgi:hypothetical protein